MNKNGQILSALVDEDFGIKVSTKWVKGIEHDSLVIDTERGIFFWNSKNIVGDPLIYLTKIRGMAFKDAIEYLKQFEYSGTHVWTFRSKGKEVVVFPELVNIFHDLGRDKKKREYLYARGLQDSIIDRFQIGWYNDYIMIPFFMDGTFRNFQMRRDKPNKVMKSYYSGVGPLLFNSDILKITDTVYITEGPIDALILIQNGLPAISTNCSGNIFPEWYHKFVNQKLIFIVFDNDNAGKTESKRVAEVLGVTRCKIYNFWDFDKRGYDPVDYFNEGNTIDQFIDLVENNSLYSYQYN